MYFFKLEPLRDQLATQGLPERDRYKYVMAWMITMAIQLGMGNPLNGNLKTGAVLLDLVITFLGVRYAWRRNGAEHGAGFLDRYFSIGWVVMLRAIVAVNLIGALVLYTPLRRVADLLDDAGGLASSLSMSDEEPQESDAEAGAFAALLGLLSSVYVARATGNHVGRVREAAEQRGGLAPQAAAPAPVGAFHAAAPAPTPSSAPGLDRFVESVVQRELAAGSSGVRRSGRRRSTIRPLRSSRKAVRKVARKPKRRRR
jgi:hypothetical protein